MRNRFLGVMENNKKRKKKTLLSILAGLAVIGSASADVTVDQRKELCAKHPEKYVWVEKDQFCAPINTCRNADGS